MGRRRPWNYSMIALWTGGLALLGLFVAGSGFVRPLGEARASHSEFDRSQAVDVASGWAEAYVVETLGTQYKVDSSPLALSDMKLVSAEFHANAQDLVTSVTSAVSLPAPASVWVVAWERDAMPNVTTGKSDGTAHVVIVMEDGTGKVRDALASIRQPEHQARARSGELPSFDELLGNAMRLAQSQCDPGPREAGGAIVPLTCK